MIQLTLEEQARRIHQKRAEFGIEGPLVIAANPGSHRSEEKRALLRRLRELNSPFEANIGDQDAVILAEQADSRWLR
jgi:hypothetical protein